MCIEHSLAVLTTTSHDYLGTTILREILFVSFICDTLYVITTN